MKCKYCGTRTMIRINKSNSETKHYICKKCAAICQETLEQKFIWKTNVLEEKKEEQHQNFIQYACKPPCENATAEECFRNLCKSLYMDFVLDEDNEYMVQNENGQNYVYKLNKEEEIFYIYDDRGDLFVALRNVAVNMFPNVGFRGDNYIYK